MRPVPSRMVRDRARRGAVGRLLATGVAAASVVLVSASTPPPREADLPRSPGTVSFGVDAAFTTAAPQLPPVSVGRARVERSKGTPQLPPSAFDHLGIPATALLAYQRAAAVIGQADASCGLSWTLLAAIGRVESDHGRADGARLRSDGTSSPVIRGVVLDGAGPVARVRDTDGGTLDGNPAWDRAVGPMQLLPSTWSVVGVDADGDSVRSPDDIDDAALAAAVFLCATTGDLTTRNGLRTAIHRYNPSSSYVASVLALDRAYRAHDAAMLESVSLGGPVGILTLLATGGGQARAVPSGSTGAVPPGAPRADRRQTVPAGSAPGPHAQGTTDGAPTGPGPGPTDTPGSGPPGPPGPTGPTGPVDPGATDSPEPGVTDSPDPVPDPVPDPSSDPVPDPVPDPVTLVGVLTACDTGWCLDQLSLDVGAASFLAAAAGADLDADGIVESNSDELTGLAGTEVSVLVASDAPPARVLAVDGLAYVEG